MLPEHQGNVKTEIAKGLPDVFKLSHIAFREQKKDLTWFCFKTFVHFMTYNWVARNRYLQHPFYSSSASV